VFAAVAACGGAPAPAPVAPVVGNHTVEDPAARYERLFDAAQVAEGAQLAEREGCHVCHSVDGTPGLGPSWRGSWGTTITLSDGSEVVFDEAYVNRAMREPNAQARPGLPTGMPNFDGQLREREYVALIAYIWSLR